MARSHSVTLTLLSSGRVVDVWDRYSIVQDIFSPGNPWTFSFWNSQTRETSWDVLRREVRFGAKILLAIDDAPQLTGIIEQIQFGNQRSGAQLIISGRDLAGPAVSWDADPRVTLRNSTLEDVVTALLEPFGIPLVIGVDAIAARETQQRVRRGTRANRRTRRQHRIDQLHPRPGEKVWALIDQSCRKVGLLPWIAPDSDGNLSVVIDSPIRTGEPEYQFRWALQEDGTAEPGSNILSGEWKLDYGAVPTSVAIMAHASRGDSLPARTQVTILNDVTIAHPFAASNPPPATHPRYIESHRAHDPDSAHTEAQRILAEANAGFERYTCTVQGHSQRSAHQAGADILYAINTAAHVRDDTMWLDKDMIVLRVQFDGSRDDDKGHTTQVTMAPLGSIKIIPQAGAT